MSHPSQSERQYAQGACPGPRARLLRRVRPSPRRGGLTALVDEGEIETKIADEVAPTRDLSVVDLER
jgi:hypothetical protein